MPLWPFRRRSRRKRGRANTLDTDEYAAPAAGPGLPPSSQTAPVVAMAADAHVPERHPSKKQRTEPKKLQRRGRAFSFSPGRHDSVRVASSRAQRGGAETSMSHAPSGYTWRVDHGARATPSGLDTVQDEMLWRVPTLHNKRGADQLPRKTSNKKRRQEDQEREAQIRAMCAFEPVRPATEDWMAGRPIKKESRRARTGFGIGIKGSEFDKYNRSSDISLPLPDSIDSAASSDSEHISYKVSALEALAPRPTLRYSTNPRPGTYARDGAPTSRGPSQQRRKLAAPIPEETLKANKRIDDLADDLSASDLRELMERDQRRRARKQQLEQEKQKRRIARRAEKQKATDAEAARLGRQSPPNMERGVLGREDVGLGLDPASAIVTSSRIRNSDDLPQRPEQDDDLEPARDPLAAFHRVDSHPLQTPKEPSEPREPQQPVPTLASPPSRASFRRKLSRSKSPQESEPRTERSEILLNGAPGGSARAQRSWTSIFKWGSKNKRHSGGPSSFSNTSRDSMVMTIPTPTPPINIIPRHVSSKLPKRTMSRFREDLPELPISPPASRIQSPDADAIYPFAPSADLYPASSLASRPRQGTVGSEQRSVEGTRETPSTVSHMDEPGVSPEPQAMSLASIDSEGSWFSGRLTSKKRKSSGILEQAPGLRLPRRTPESDSERQPEPDHPADDMHITDDDYLSRLAPPQTERNAFNRKSTGEARPSSDWEEEEEAHWGSVRGRQPKVVRSEMAERVKSREGLLNVFGEEGEAAMIETMETDDAAESSEHESSDGTAEVGLQRATSLNLGHAHARRISAGSARLLSISPRSSVDAKGVIAPAERRE
ncbi:hypothetical protein C8A05DRAFT_34145 [Staphylotrichum tortipilum]|uniref:Uncharacterized protein n=1 Tax=Staphylotrichum tortipilum TaxID=2831512 RepID=A0AAN6MKI0_9PEZI|nr:hypothetical protein C8A05DRAFT_34145 [Staphylotrichum longicolle]